MVEILNRAVARGRRRINRANQSLNRANELADESGGVAINIVLCNRIRLEHQRVIDARARFVKQPHCTLLRGDHHDDVRTFGLCARPYSRRSPSSRAARYAARVRSEADLQGRPRDRRG